MRRTTACEAEPRDPSVMHWVGLHEAARAQREAIKLNQAGDLPKAREALKKVASTITEYAGEDEALKSSLAELEEYRGSRWRTRRCHPPTRKKPCSALRALRAGKRIIAGKKVNVWRPR